MIPNEQEVFEMMGFGGMGWGGLGWGGMVLGSIFMILFWVFIVAAVVWLVLALGGQVGTRQAPRESSAQAILEERLARGEIDVDEYKARKAAIGGSR